MSAPLACVVDASVTVQLFLSEPLSGVATQLFDILANDPTAIFHAPDLIYAECINVFWKHCRRGTLHQAQTPIFLKNLLDLRLLRTETRDLAADALDLALTHAISAYDACYVALSHRLNVPLITADQKLVQKFLAATPAVVWLANWTPPAAPTP